MKVRKMRLFRIKHGISRHALGNICGVSPQRISIIETDVNPVLKHSTKESIIKAFEEIIEARNARQNCLRDDFERHRNSLFESVEENDYEL